MRARISNRSPRRDERDPYQEELAQIEEELDTDAQRVVAYVEELRQLGVEPTSVSEGLVDFPAILDGRPVYLCWRLGEPEVGFWHEVDAGFRGRQPVADLWEVSPSPVGGTARLN